MRQATRQRQERIMAQLLERKHVLVTALAAGMSISESTVRRDLRALAAEGRVRLVHGGATALRDGDPGGSDPGSGDPGDGHLGDGDCSFQVKQQRNPGPKQLAATLAAEQISDGDHVFLDSGTTCFEMAAGLRARRGVTVLINSIRLASELHSPELNVILLGGQYRPGRIDAVGPIAIHAIEQLRGYVAFIGSDGLNMDGGPAAVDIESADLYRAVIGNARETVLVVDHTKFERASLYPIVEWDRVDRLVCDREPPPEWGEFLRERNIEMIYPSESHPSE
jgi:DeoR/GlpR family transcriptional regulator of sugar metabolism